MVSKCPGCGCNTLIEVKSKKHRGKQATIGRPNAIQVFPLYRCYGQCTGTFYKNKNNVYKHI